jgi:ectoine hydroxylase-related dioxygenase (phytanoyl-CoA dioxygenase family)
MKTEASQKVDFSRELNEPYDLSPESIKLYREKGYVKLKNVLSPELLEYYGEVITEWVFKLNKLTKPMEERTTYEKAFLQVMNLWRENESIKEFVFSKKLARIAAQLMEVDGVRLYHDQALYKEPSGGITPWHADQFYWPLSNANTVTVWVPLQATPMEMGPLAFAEASQDVEIGRDKEISDESEAILAETLKQFPIHETPFDLGEVSYHSGWTYHRAGTNSSKKARRVMNGDLHGQGYSRCRTHQRIQDRRLEYMVDSKPVGSVADGKLNPVLYSKTKTDEYSWAGRKNKRRMTRSL